MPRRTRELFWLVNDAEERLSQPRLLATAAGGALPGRWIGSSGWFYWHWRGPVYPEELPTRDWFKRYQRAHNSVELNAPFYRWPRAGTVRRWLRDAAPGFRYSVKVNQLITHEKRFVGTRRLIREFYETVELLGPHMGCFLFQLPPSFHYSYSRLRSILTQLDPRYRNVVEFRHLSWWNQSVYDGFRDAGLAFCSLSAARMPADIVNTNGRVYARFHGAQRWYRYDYSRQELKDWADRLRNSGAKEIWAYFNNDPEGCAFRNARLLRRFLNRVR